jgi:Uma2 family endonuclease
MVSRAALFAGGDDPDNFWMKINLQSIFSATTFTVEKNRNGFSSDAVFYCQERIPAPNIRM